MCESKVSLITEDGLVEGELKVDVLRPNDSNEMLGGALRENSIVLLFQKQLNVKKCTFTFANRSPRGIP